MNKAKIDNAIFIKEVLSIAFRFIFDLPVRFIKLLFLLFVTSFAVLIGAFIFYFILEFIINLFVDFKLEGEDQWIAISGISCWIGIYIGVKAFRDNETADLVSSGLALFDFSQYSNDYDKINSGIINKMLKGQSHFQDIDLTLKVPEFWKSEKPIKISDLEKSKDIEVLGENPQGWLALKYRTYKFVAKYGKEEKKLKAVQVFSRKEKKGFVDFLSTDNETQILLEYMVQKDFRVLYVPLFIPIKSESIEIFKKQYKKDKDYEKKKNYFLTHTDNRFERLYMHINNYFNFQLIKKQNHINYTASGKELLVEDLKEEIRRDFGSFFDCLEKVGNTYVRQNRE